MKRFLYLAPALILVLAWPGRGFWGPVVMLGGLIFFHELGHFLAAKGMGMPVETFSLGFGPRLLGFKWRETDVRLSVLPLGGYVKLAGYNPEEPDAEDPHGFLAQPAWRRLLFYSGGILANVATALVLMCVLGAHESRIKPAPLNVYMLTTGDVAQRAGLQVDDRILSIGELKFPGSTWEEAVAYIQARPGAAIPFRVSRRGVDLELSLTPRLEGGKGRVGLVAWASVQEPLRFSSVLRGAGTGTVETARMAGQVVAGFGRLFTHAEGLKEIGGPIAIAKIGSDAAKSGWITFLLVTALLSMNLAILNALPIPFLDGGHIAILALEKIRGRDFSVQLKERILVAGFYFLTGLIVLVLAHDLWRLRH